MNLHVSRQWSAAEGFPDADKLDELGKVVSYFDPHALDLQRQYARELLTHTNPYTGMSYAADPAVGVIEIDNEDSLIGLADFLPALPSHYRDELTAGEPVLEAEVRLHEQLARRVEPWAHASWSKPGTNGRFEAGQTGWIMETHNAAIAHLDVVDDSRIGRAVRLSGIRSDGTDWDLQFKYPGIDLKEGQRYTLSFTALSTLLANAAFRCCSTRRRGPLTAYRRIVS